MRRVFADELPMFERYTENARRALFFARYEASQFGGGDARAHRRSGAAAGRMTE
jgi:hypothetical protein